MEDRKQAAQHQHGHKEMMNQEVQAVRILKMIWKKEQIMSINDDRKASKGEEGVTSMAFDYQGNADSKWVSVNAVGSELLSKGGCIRDNNKCTALVSL